MPTSLKSGTFVALLGMACLSNVAWGTLELCNQFAKKAHEEKRKLMAYSDDSAGTTTGDHVTLTCDKDLSEKADVYAKHLAATGKWEHDAANPYGENIHRETRKVDEVVTDTKDKTKNKKLYVALKPGEAIENAVEGWFKEIHCYNYADPLKHSGVVGHFTAVVWKTVIAIGIGVGVAADGKITVVGHYKTSDTETKQPNYGLPNGAEYLANVPKPKSSANIPLDMKLCQPTDSEQTDIYPKQAALPEALEAAAKAMPTMADAEAIKKGRNLVARLAMLTCESNPAIKQRFAPGEQDDAAKVMNMITATVCETNANTKDKAKKQTDVQEYLNCIQKTARQYQIDHFLTGPSKKAGIEKFAYDRKVAQHRCEYSWWTNWQLYNGDTSKWPLLKAAQAALPA